MAKPKTTTKTASTSNKIKTIASKKRTLSAEKAQAAEIKKLKAEIAQLRKDKEADRIADLTSRSRKSKTVFFREPKSGDSDVFFGYIVTKNPDGSEYIHKFSREEITSRFGSVYHQGYKFFVSKEEVAKRSENAKAQLEQKSVQSAAAEDAAC